MTPFLDLTASYRELKPEIDAAVAPSPRLPPDPRFVIAQRSVAIQPCPNPSPKLLRRLWHHISARRRGPIPGSYNVVITF